MPQAGGPDFWWHGGLRSTVPLLLLPAAGDRDAFLFADSDALRALRGHVDAAVVPPSVHQAAGFAALVAERDP